MDMASLMAQMQGGQGKQAKDFFVSCMSLHLYPLFRRCWRHGRWRRWNGHGIIDGSDARRTRYESLHLHLQPQLTFLAFPLFQAELELEPVAKELVPTLTLKL